MGQTKRIEYINQRAYDLAASGFHINPITVITALVQEGYPEAAELLNSAIIRADLRRVCVQHWRGVKTQIETPPPLAANNEARPLPQARAGNRGRH